VRLKQQYQGLLLGLLIKKERTTERKTAIRRSESVCDHCQGLTRWALLLVSYQRLSPDTVPIICHADPIKSPLYLKSVMNTFIHITNC
jgi:hypothetical protein